LRRPKGDKLGGGKTYVREAEESFIHSESGESFAEAETFVPLGREGILLGNGQSGKTGAGMGEELVERGYHLT